MYVLVVSLNIYFILLNNFLVNPYYNIILYYTLMSTDSRKKQREDQQISLREKKRTELLQRKRMTVESEMVEMSDFKNKKKLLFSKSLREVMDGVIAFRKCLSIEEGPPIQAVIDAGLVPRLVELLAREHALYNNGEIGIIRKIRCEAAWALTNIASGSTEQTQKIIDYGAIPLFSTMLQENDEDVVDQAAWAFGNIAGDSEIMRDAVINCDVLKISIKLTTALLDGGSIKVLRNITWLLANLNRGRDPPPKLENMIKTAELLVYLIDFNDEDIRNDSLWAISYIADNEEAVHILFKLGLIEKVFIVMKKYLEFTTSKMILPAIRTVGNIVTTTDNNVDLLLSMELLPVLCDIFENFPGDVTIKKLRKEICWILSNIACGSVKHALLLLNARVQKILFSTVKLQNYIKMEACWALTNIMKHAETNKSVFELCLTGKYFRFLSDCLETFDTYVDIRVQIVTTVRKLLISGRRWSDTHQNMIVLYKECNCISDVMRVIEAMQYEDGEVRSLAECLCAEYEEECNLL